MMWKCLSADFFCIDGPASSKTMRLAFQMAISLIVPFNSAIIDGMDMDGLTTGTEACPEAGLNQGPGVSDSRADSSFLSDSVGPRSYVLLDGRSFKTICWLGSAWCIQDCLSLRPTSVGNMRSRHMVALVDGHFFGLSSLACGPEARFLN